MHNENLHSSKYGWNCIKWSISTSGFSSLAIVHFTAVPLKILKYFHSILSYWSWSTLLVPESHPLCNVSKSKLLFTLGIITSGFTPKRKTRKDQLPHRLAVTQIIKIVRSASNCRRQVFCPFSSPPPNSDLQCVCQEWLTWISWVPLSMSRFESWQVSYGSAWSIARTTGTRQNSCSWISLYVTSVH